MCAVFQSYYETARKRIGHEGTREPLYVTKAEFVTDYALRTNVRETTAGGQSCMFRGTLRCVSSPVT